MKISDHLIPGEFTFNGMKLGHSSFNCAWMYELGIENPKVIFDIGGYDAGDAIRLKHIFPNAEVHCFEADPQRAKIIREYIRDANVLFMGAAITDYTGMLQFYQSACNLKDAGDTHQPGKIGGQGSAYKHAETYKQLYPHIDQDVLPITVPCFSLSDYCRKWEDIKEIDLLHIDVEGSEINVIKGLGLFRPKVIYLETLPNMFEGVPSVNELHSTLDHMGYELVKDFVSDRLYIYKN